PVGHGVAVDDEEAGTVGARAHAPTLGATADAALHSASSVPPRGGVDGSWQAGAMTDRDLLIHLQATVGPRGTLTERLGIEFLSASPERVVARMPVEGNTQVVGVLHGGAWAALAETVASVAASLHAGEGRGAVGVDLNASHHRAV